MAGARISDARRLRTLLTAPGAEKRSLDSFSRELDRRLSGEYIGTGSGSGIAQLFRFTYQRASNASALLHVLHRQLLKRTIHHARWHTTFYNSVEYHQTIGGEPGDPPELSSWPLLRRDRVIDQFHDFIADDVTFASAPHTSGSTGPALSVYKSVEELSFLWSYYRELLRPARESCRTVPLVLFFPNLYHGAGVPLPSVGKVFVSGVTDDTLISDAARLIHREHYLPGHDSRISIINGLSFHVKLFTAFLLEQGHELTALAIQGLNVVGEYAPEVGRRFLEDAWQAPVTDRFTLTESVAGATRCVRCGYFHLDPHVIGEVVDPDGEAAVRAGVGELVLTDLYPFVQMQPMLRYRTGDLVRRVSSDCANTLTFAFLGKRTNCIGWDDNGQKRWLIFSANLHDILSGLPDVRTFDSFPNLRSVRDRTLASPPIFTQRIDPASSGAVKIDLTVELRYSPEYFRERAMQLRTRLVEELRNCNSTLRRRMTDGAVDLQVEFVGPGALGDAYAIKV